MKRRNLRRFEGSRVVVNCSDGGAYNGVMSMVLADCIVLRAALAQPPGQKDAQPADGEVILQRDMLSMIQRPFE